jgi:hypothetical protein
MLAVNQGFLFDAFYIGSVAFSAIFIEHGHFPRACLTS